MKKELVILVILFIPIITLIVFWDQLPDQLPIHWNHRGEVDAYGPKYLLALINVGLYFLLVALPYFDPRKSNYKIFSGTYYKIRLLLTLFFSLICGIIYANALGLEMNMGRIVGLSILAIITVLGNYFGNIRPNWFVGIKTPWTLESEEVWKKTHILGGRLWFWGGLFGIICSFFLSNAQLFSWMLVITIVISIIPVVYSYFLFKWEQKNDSGFV